MDYSITNIHAAKTHFSKLIAQVENGKKVVIGRAGKPVAVLVPYETKTTRRKARVPGGWEYKVWTAEEGSLQSDEIERLIMGTSIEPDERVQGK